MKPQIMVLMFFTLGGLIFGQTATAGSKQPAPVKAESADTQPKPAAGEKALNEREQMLKGLYETFWKAVDEDRLDAAYLMHCASFREEVTLGEYFRAKRAKQVDRVFRKIEFHTDECAEVQYYYSMTSGPMDLKNVPGRQVWFIEDGEWRVFDKKKARNIGGMGMVRGSKAKPPCGKGSDMAKAKSRELAEKRHAARAGGKAKAGSVDSTKKK